MSPHDSGVRHFFHFLRASSAWMPARVGGAGPRRVVERAGGARHMQKSRRPALADVTWRPLVRWSVKCRSVTTPLVHMHRYFFIRKASDRFISSPTFFCRAALQLVPGQSPAPVESLFRAGVYCTHGLRRTVARGVQCRMPGSVAIAQGR